MTTIELQKLLQEVRSDYIAMARDLSRFKKRLATPLDPSSLPLVKGMDRAIHDLSVMNSVPRVAQR